MEPACNNAPATYPPAAPPARHAPARTRHAPAARTRHAPAPARNKKAPPPARGSGATKRHANKR